MVITGRWSGYWSVSQWFFLVRCTQAALWHGLKYPFTRIYLTIYTCSNSKFIISFLWNDNFNHLSMTLNCITYFNLTILSVYPFSCLAWVHVLQMTKSTDVQRHDMLLSFTALILIIWAALTSQNSKNPGIEINNSLTCGISALFFFVGNLGRSLLLRKTRQM